MVKQVIIIRRDLKMRRGKEIAQGAHASLKWISDRIRASQPIYQSVGDFRSEGEAGGVHLNLSDHEREWLFGLFTKICLQVDFEADLLALHKAAQEAGLTSCLIQDSGKTEFGGVPTHTALAIGPNASEPIDRITGHLSIY